jgi:tripartite-type tricarboxylate transporter receptor subunit TctC
MPQILPRAARAFSRLCLRAFGSVALGSVALGSVAFAPAAVAQTRITHSIRLIVPYVPGGGTDILSRLLGPAIGDEFGQQVVIDNKPGGGSTIGTGQVAKAAPDGYTLGMIDAAFVTNPSLMKQLPYDTLKDFAPIVLVATSPLVMVVPPAQPPKSVAEFVAYAKSKPGQLSFGSAGIGTGVHLAAEQFRAAAGLQMTHIPYKGTGQAVTELVGGQTNMLFVTQSSAKPMTVSGRMRSLAITSPKRSAVMPEVPTFAESGFPQVDAVTINGIVAPAGTPPDFIARVNSAVNKALKTKDIMDKMGEQGFNAEGGTPEEFAAWLPREIPKWARVVKEADIKVE